MPIKVAIDIRAPMELLWHRTQDPGEHRRWDLRFTDIEYLPPEGGDAPQRFRYATRLGFGLAIEGWGETAGKRRESAARATALRFGSDQPLSLITEGSGYWKYAPGENGIRFSTAYDYRVRFGRMGRLLDRVFRPLMAWANAWSFDSLRIWLETGTPPEIQRRLAGVHALARTTLAFVWIYHGLVPKLLYPHTGERILLTAAGLPVGFLPWIGAAEIGLGLLTLVAWRANGLMKAQAALVALVTLGALTSPAELTKPFNPLTLNAALIALALTASLSGRDLPSAWHCQWSVR
ncbi:MAG: DoxX-like family protein [Fimbriimonas sp.]